MKTMKALRFEKYGPPSVLSIQELPVPDLKTGEALIELQASAIRCSSHMEAEHARRARGNSR